MNQLNLCSYLHKLPVQNKIIWEFFYLKKTIITTTISSKKEEIYFFQELHISYAQTKIQLILERQITPKQCKPTQGWPETVPQYKTYAIKKENKMLILQEHRPGASSNSNVQNICLGSHKT